MKINTISYVFENKQPELRRLVVKYGLTPAKNRQDLWKKVNYLVAKFKSEFLKDIANIHPDKDLILWSQNSDKSDAPVITEPTKVAVIKEEVKSSACGCSGADGNYSNCAGNPECTCGCPSKEKKIESTSNAEGDKKSMADVLKDNMPLVIIGSLVLVGGLIFLGNKNIG